MTQQDYISDTASQSGRAAIYVRPAAGRQTQTTQQLNVLIALANELGYPKERIIVYEDGGSSTREPLVMRRALNDLLAAITQTKQKQEQERIRSVFVSSPYRLFRDPTGVDIATFLHTCAEHNVSIVTSEKTFNLTDPAQIALFRSQCEAAHQYITAQITRLGAGKRRKRQTGE